MRVYLSIFYSLLLLVSVNAFSQRQKVIYGEDNRLDIYDVRDAQLVEAAKSTAGVLSNTDITFIENGTKAKLNTENYGTGMRLCKKERFYSQPTAVFCSASLIAPDLVLTAGHCIKSENDCSSTSFVFGFQMNSETEAVTTVPAQDVVKCQKIISRELNSSNGADYAVVKIDKKITHRKPLELSTNVNLSKGDEVVVIGHPSGLPVKVSGGAQVRTSDDAKGYFVANLDTYGGNSGSAVINPSNGKVEGVLVRGETDFVSEGGCKVSNICANDSCRGEDVTKGGYIKKKLQTVLGGGGGNQGGGWRPRKH